MKQEHFYTEPRKENSMWLTEKMSMDGKLVSRHHFPSKLKVDAFLEEKNFYITSSDSSTKVTFRKDG